MNSDEKQILEAELWKLSPSAQAVAKKLLAAHADEFAADEALNFLRGQPFLPMRAHEVSQDLIDKLNATVQIIRGNPSVWLSTDDLPHEIWHDITDYEGLYQVSNYGRIKSLHYGQILIIKVTLNEKGYPYVSLYKNGRGKKRLVHGLVAVAFIPNPESKPEVNHIDANKTNACVWNLEWVTLFENRRHASKMGLLKGNCVSKGAKNPNAKLDEKKVWQILESYIPYDLEFGARVLAKKFGVREGAIHNVLSGNTYKDVYAEWLKQKALSL